MALSKKYRFIVWNKSNGYCWYCGCNLPEKGWHADHFKPLLRNCGKDGDLYPERDTLNNYVPSCAPCNLFKATWSLEQFREQISLQIERARKSSKNFRVAEKFGLIEIVKKPVVFWFELNVINK